MHMVIVNFYGTAMILTWTQDLIKHKHVPTASGLGSNSVTAGPRLALSSLFLLPNASAHFVPRKRLNLAHQAKYPLRVHPFPIKDLNFTNFGAQLI